ncbi:unnamed protein product [Linum tenue]|uniref:TIR domain-containing protein n=1 Tax=Linum tenue TaxID=586396 RepID=A0AAV0IHW4_9ROSI|nr:unnamed protein product [Linum tenue]
MDRVRLLWFWIRNWMTNLLLHYFPPSPDRSPTLYPDNPTAAAAAAVSPRERRPPPIICSPFSAPSAEGRKYEVFVSFRGVDTRRGFTSHLCDALSSKLGISLVYKDELCLEKGASVAPELLKAIEDSRIAVVVLSRNYAGSSWCLDELVHILRCRKRRDLRVIPIFYEVDPSDVRKQKGGSSFGAAFAKLGRVSAGAGNKLRNWRDALTEVANLSGFATAHYRNDSDMIKEIAGKIWKELSPTYPSISKPLVGIDRRVKAVINLLRLDSIAERRDVRIIGISGIGGSGKTTVAMAVYDTIRSGFEFSTYVGRIGEACNAYGGLLQLQKQLFSELAGNAMVAGLEAWPEYGGIERLKRMFKGKKLLLIVDDITHQKQLQYLAVEHSLFGLGSRVIITCRDKHLLNAHRVDCIYETQLMDDNEARMLLSQKAFEQQEPLEDYRYVSEQILSYAQGLPLALEVLGSSLRGRSVSECRSIIKKLKRIPPGEILEVLKVSYDVLDEEEKDMFLDFVFFFNGFNPKPCIVRFLPCMVVEYLYPDAGVGIRNLMDKALLQVKGRYRGGNFYMHPLLDEMGREIVRLECPNEPGQRSRLTGYRDVCHVLTKQTGSEKVKIISLRGNFQCLHKITSSPEAFSRMVNLKLLELRYVKMKEGPNELPDELRYLSWSHYPSESLPFTFNPHRLFLLQLDYSDNLKQLWHGNKVSNTLSHMLLTMTYLTRMDLRFCNSLIVSPDFTGTPNLEFLSLEGCGSLLEVHSSFGNLKRLASADFIGCKSLEVFPTSLEAESLKFLSLQGCSKLKRFPTIDGNMDCLAELDLQGVGIQQLDATIGRLVGLTRLNLQNCECLTSLPDSLGCLTLLYKLDLNGCRELEDLPPSLQLCISLEYLRVEDCVKLKSLPELPPYIKSVEAKGCKSLEEIPDTINLRSNRVHIDCRQCFKLDQSESLGWRMLQRCLQATPTPEREFDMVTPAGINMKMDIPDWLLLSSHRTHWSSLAMLPPDDDLKAVSNPDWIGTVVVLCFRVVIFGGLSVQSVCRKCCSFQPHLVGASLRRQQAVAEEQRQLWLSYVPKGSLGNYFANPVSVCPHIEWDWCEYRNVYSHEVEEWKK